MNKSSTSYILSHQILIRILIAILFLLLLLSIFLSIKELYYREIKYFEILSIFCCLFLLIWFSLLLTDSWRIIKINNEFILECVFFIEIIKIYWKDVKKIKIGKTNQFNNFVQSEIIILISENNKKIKISKK
jgi:hypothetical protein